MIRLPNGNPDRTTSEETDGEETDDEIHVTYHEPMTVIEQEHQNSDCPQNATNAADGGDITGQQNHELVGELIDAPL